MSNEKKVATEMKKTKQLPAQAGKAAGEKKIIRIAETDLDGSQAIEHALSHIKGVNWSYAHAIRNALGLPNKKLAELSEEEINKVKEALVNPQKFGIPTWLYNRRKDLLTGKDFHLLASDLVLAEKMDVKFLKTIKTYRGIRHSYNYKVRGQRTKSHGANVRGRIGGTVGVVKKKATPGSTKKESKKEEKK